MCMAKSNVVIVILIESNDIVCEMVYNETMAKTVIVMLY